MLHKPFPQSLRHAFPAGMLSRFALVLALGWGVAGKMPAQDIPPDGTANVPPPQPRAGLQIRTASAYAVYYSSSLPNTNGGFQPSAANLPSDVGGGGSATFEWSKFTERSSFSLTYTPSYTGRVRFSSLNALNHTLALNVSRKLAPRWTLSFSAAGDLSSLEQSLFAPTSLSNVASVPATFDDLEAAMLAGKFANNPQLGTILTGAPLLQSPLTTLLYGERMLTSSAQASLSYSYSPRLTLTVTGGAGRTQHLADDQNQNTASAYLIPNTTSGRASVTLSYSLSPLTQIGGSVTTNRISTSVQDAYTTTSLVTLGRSLRRRWLVQVHGGVGVTNPVRQTLFALTTKPRPAAGGSLGYKTPSQTILGLYDRTVSDSFGLGATTSSTATASWRWSQPGRSWWLESSVGWQQLQGNVLSNTSGWHASAGVGRAIGAHLALLTQYAYLEYSGQLQNSAYSLSQSSVRVSLIWTPHPVTGQ